MVNIALCGKANSGKNAVAQLIQSHTSNFEIVAFADPIKELVMNMFPWADRECLFGSSKLRGNTIGNAKDSSGNPLTYRQALIDLGTLARGYDPKHWINVFSHRLSIISNPIICTDVRFENEFNFLKEKGFILIKIKRSNNVLIDHVTETSQDSIEESKFDYVISNNGTLEDLKLEINRAIFGT